MKRFMVALALPALLIGCSKDSKPKKPSSDGGSNVFWMQTSPVITVTTEDETPIANAQILIGDALNAPFSGNLLTTDANGQVSLPAAWTGPQSVTIQAPGFVRVTYMGQEPGPLNIKLRLQPNKNQYEVKGVTSGLPIKDKDGYVDFGLVMPAFSKLNLLSFNIESIISPQRDIIKAMGQEIPVPANTSLPKQNEKYSLFTVTLDKPTYRVYYGAPGITRVFAARGRFPFKSTVDRLRGGTEFYDLINDFKISGGAIRDIEIKSGQTRLDMPTQELNFTEAKSVMPPQFRADETFLAVSLAKQSGLMVPTDVKKATQGKAVSLNTMTGADPFVLAVLKKSAEFQVGGSDRMSATILPFTTGTTPSMLPLVADPSFGSSREILLPKVSTIAGVNPIATYSVLSKEEEVMQGPEKVKIHLPHWEVYSHDWIENMKLPEWPNDVTIAGTKRWEVNFLGSQTASQAPMGPAMIESATHVTHSSISF